MASKRRACVGLVITIIYAAFAVLIIGAICGAKGERDAAITAGAALWIVDPTTGIAKFVYCCKCEEVPNAK